jgi:hypothetical protein
MAMCRHHLPRFRPTCLGVGATFMFLAASQLVRGIPAAMHGFGIPELVLASPHYRDAMFWVFTHMFVLGAIIAVVGHFAESARTRRAFARLLLAAVSFYTVLDLRTADWALGSGLYQGARSLVPPVIDVIVLLLFAHLSFCKDAAHAHAPTARA